MPGLVYAEQNEALMTVRAEVRGELITWARERARADLDDLSRRFPKLQQWESEEVTPTLKQLEAFAQATHAPLGFLFLPEPPEESVPLPDFRSMGDAALRRPSPDLLDTLFQCEQRQEWYRDYGRANREEPLSFVGSLDLTTSIVEAAETMGAALGFQVEDRGARWADAFRKLTEQAEELGVLVMVNGVVGSNTHRKLNPQEFRGFAMVDDIAPLIFVNGADTKAAQIFSLAHELAHIWLGQSALSDVEVSSTSGNTTERWCNEVAAEMLVPLHSLRDAFSADRPLTDELDRLAREFKVSTLVVLRRIRDAGHLTAEQYRSAYTAELDRVLGILAEGISSGGNFYNTQTVRVSRRFARAVISSTLEGQTLYRDALQMLGIKKLSTFQELSHRLGIA